MKRLYYSAIAVSFMLSSSATLAGEIKGPPPEGNLADAPPISNGKSFCSFSGLNDTPDGLPPTATEPGDPGGQVQSYGYFMSHFDAFDPSDPAQRETFTFPGTGCNGSKFQSPSHD